MTYIFAYCTSNYVAVDATYMEFNKTDTSQLACKFQERRSFKIFKTMRD